MEDPGSVGRERKNIFVQRGVVSRPSYLLSGLVAQSEITILLNRLYGSYGERLIANYQRGTKEALAISSFTEFCLLEEDFVETTAAPYTR